MKNFYLFLVIILLSNCQTNENSNQNNKLEKLEANPSLAEALVGEWHNVSMRVEVQGDTLSVFEANEANWEKELGIKIIKTFFRADGTYNSEHYTLADSLFLDVKGTWKIAGDNINMYQSLPSPTTTNCKISISDDLVYFDCMLDWDNDGSNDDQYLGVQRKQ